MGNVAFDMDYGRCFWLIYVSYFHEVPSMRTVIYTTSNNTDRVVN